MGSGGQGLRRSRARGHEIAQHQDAMSPRGPEVAQELTRPQLPPAAGPLRNLPALVEAFRCPVGSGMNPELKTRRRGDDTSVGARSVGFFFFLFFWLSASAEDEKQRTKQLEEKRWIDPILKTMTRAGVGEQAGY